MQNHVSPQKRVGYLKYLIYQSFQRIPGENQKQYQMIYYTLISNISNKTYNYLIVFNIFPITSRKMSDFKFNPSSHRNDNVNHNQPFSEGLPHKGPCTTKFTENPYQNQLPESFILGKNDFMGKDTEASFDSDDNESQLSFQQKIQFDHSKTMVRALDQYFSQNHFQNQNVLIDERIHFKSRDIIKEKQEKTLNDIKNKYGTQEETKIKLMIKFIKNNNNTVKIYHDVLKRFAPQFRFLCYFLLKQTVITYLAAREELKKHWKSLDRLEIKSYFQQNLPQISSRVKLDEKQGLFKFSQDDQHMKKQFQSFILNWMMSFFLSKEGFPSQNKEKEFRDRDWELRSIVVAENRKKIKK